MGRASIQSIDYAIQIDTVGGNITYIGKSLPGSSTSNSTWQIMRIDESSNPEIIIQWADGNKKFDNIWDARLILDYS